MERIHRILDQHEQEGGKILVDGRSIKMESPYDQGNFIGPSILTNLTTNMIAYKEEIFGPVMCVLKVNNLDEAINILNS